MQILQEISEIHCFKLVSFVDSAGIYVIKVFSPDVLSNLLKKIHLKVAPVAQR